jgi:hypothetical protein
MIKEQLLTAAAGSHTFMIFWAQFLEKKTLLHERGTS